MGIALLGILGIVTIVNLPFRQACRRRADSGEPRCGRLGPMQRVLAATVRE